METNEFLSFVTHPTNVDATSLKQLEEVIRSYPYCQTAQLLYAFNLLKEKHPHYNNQLKKAAAYANDRRKLKQLVNLYKAAQPLPERPEPAPKIPVTPVLTPLTPPTPPLKPSPVIVSPPPVPPSVPPPPAASPPISGTPSKKVAFTPVPLAEETEMNGDAVKKRLLEIVHKRLAEIAEEHGEKPVVRETADTSPSPAPGIARKSRVTFRMEPARHLSKEELIERFIREEPRISSPRTAFIQPTTLTPGRLDEDDEIVSETLAILFFKQGNVGKSIRIYEKLCLLFPEKSRYFAARINELKAHEQTGN